MNAALVGLAVGLVLGVAAAFAGLPGFLITLVLGGIGLFTGRVLDGKIDLDALLGRGRDR